MPVTVYSSTDANAPVLSGTAGALIAILDACLVTGYTGKAAAGWTKPFSGINLAAYLQPEGTSKAYYRVNDVGVSSARIIGYETMTDVNTGVNGFPTEAQSAGGLWIGKSDEASALAKPWMLITNGTIVYFLAKLEASFGFYLYAIGNIVSNKSADAFASSITAGVSAFSQAGLQLELAVTTVMPGHYIARASTQTGTSLNVNKTSDTIATAGAGAIGSGGLLYPNAADAGLYLTPIQLNEVTKVIRGYYPGLWCPCHPNPGAENDTFSGVGDLAGKTFLIKKMRSGTAVFETSNTW